MTANFRKKTFFAFAFAWILFLFLFSAHAPLPAEGAWNDENLAKIAPARGLENFSFVVVGDTQGPGSRFPKILPSILKEEPLFVFDLGDLVNYATNEEYESTFFRHVRGADVPFLTCASNHDHFKSKSASNYSRLFGSPHYYFFSIGSTCFIVLDNGQDYSLTEAQFAWLEEALEESRRFERRFVMMHRPLQDPRPNRKTLHDMSGRPENAARLSALFDGYGITMVFTGHIHSFYTGRWGETPYIITGGGGAGLYDKGTPASFHHYIRVDVFEGKVTYKAVKVNVR